MTRTTARDVMRTSFREIPAAATLRDTLLVLLAGSEDATALISTDDRGAFVGLLTPRGLLRSLFADWSPDAGADDERSAEERLLDVARERLDEPVAGLLDREVPRAKPGDSLARLMELAVDEHAYCVPVEDAGRVTGVVWLPDVFRAASGLALTDEGGGPAR